MPHRAWQLIDLVGQENAATMMRQSVHYCVSLEKNQKFVEMVSPRATCWPVRWTSTGWPSKPLGTRTADDGTLEALSQTIFKSHPGAGGGSRRGRAGRGFLAGHGRRKPCRWRATSSCFAIPVAGRIRSQRGKPEGSVHGDSIGVHACDNDQCLAEHGRRSPTSGIAAACLIMAAYQVARDRTGRAD